MFLSEFCDFFQKKIFVEDLLVTASRNKEKCLLQQYDILIGQNKVENDRNNFSVSSSTRKLREKETVLKEIWFLIFRTMCPSI